MNESYQVKLDEFEGPLDLLLHLINEYEIDIYDIPVAQITEQYMDYIHTMQRLELNIASEYLVMAATLLALKSQMLLPQQEVEEADEDYMEDPREELMERLIEYQKYKGAAEQLQDKESEANQIFTRQPIIFDYEKTSPVTEKGNLSIYDMFHALENMFERQKWNEPLETKIKSSEISIEQRMTEVLDVVKYSAAGVRFDRLFHYKSRSYIVVTFMAVLELMKHNAVTCEQTNHFDELYVFYLED